MRCKICQNKFIPNKYHPQQQVCSQPECQRIRQIQNEREWRTKNPDYFKCLGQESAWQETRHRYIRLWKADHKEYQQKYDQGHQQNRQQYMREYMRKYRKRKRQSPEKTNNVS